MKNRFLQLIAAPVALLGLGYAAPAQTTSSQAAPATKPNIVVMIADDLTYRDIGAWGNTDVKTPNLDRLAAQGMRLTGCYTPAAVCSPTRQALYTGLFPVRNGAYPNHAIVRPGVKSLPQYLKPLGYRVGLVGKTHFGPPESFPFEYPERGADAANADAANADAANADAANADAANADAANADAANALADANEETENALNYGAAASFIQRDKKQPYCLVVAPHEPHSPWNKGDASVYKPEQLKLPPYLVDTPLTRRALSRYYGEVTELDRQVGIVMAAIEKSRQADNTLFLFLSEQGSSLPHGKWTLCDAGIRSAAIARWPAKIKAGSSSGALCQYVDFLPTFIEMAGGTPSTTELDGRSILQVLAGKSNKARDFVFAEQTSRGIIAGPEAYGIRAVADEKWKYILNLNPDAEFRNTQSNSPVFKSWIKKGQTDAFAREQASRYQKRPEIELYDLQSDPFEMKNLADEPNQAANKARLRTALDAWMLQQGDKGIQTEMEALEHQNRGQNRRQAPGRH